jgi:hypothetical protein
VGPEERGRRDGSAEWMDARERCGGRCLEGGKQGKWHD